MGLQNANNNRNVHHRGGVYRPLHQLEGGYPHDGDAPGGTGARASSRLPTSKGTLYVFEDNSSALELARLP